MGGAAAAEPRQGAPGPRRCVAQRERDRGADHDQWRGRHRQQHVLEHVTGERPVGDRVDRRRDRERRDSEAGRERGGAGAASDHGPGSLRRSSRSASPSRTTPLIPRDCDSQPDVDEPAPDRAAERRHPDADGDHGGRHALVGDRAPSAVDPGRAPGDQHGPDQAEATAAAVRSAGASARLGDARRV